MCMIGTLVRDNLYGRAQRGGPPFNHWRCSNSSVWGISSHPQPDAPFLARNILAILHPNPLITSLDNVNWLVQPLRYFPPAIWLCAFIFQIFITSVINRWVLLDDTHESFVNKTSSFVGHLGFRIKQWILSQTVCDSLNISNHFDLVSPVFM